MKQPDASATGEGEVLAQPWHRRLARATTPLAFALACAATAAAAPVDEPQGLEGAAAPLEAVASSRPPQRPSLAIERLARAWRADGASLAERAARVRLVADEIGIGSLDPLARAVLWASDAGSPLERARIAVLLAPALPLAHASLAAAEWRAGAPIAAARSALDAVIALPAHLDGWLWLGATAALLGTAALALGAFVFLAARGFHSLRFVAHDLGDAIEPSMPTFARVALVAALLAIPVAFGEGLAGLALGFVALGFVAPVRGARVAVAAAALALVAAIHPLAALAGARLAAVGADPAALASWNAEAGFVDALDAIRLERAAAASGDRLALAAQAEWKRRAGDLAGADAAYARLVEDPAADVGVLSNAAAVKLSLGDPHAAIDLYRRAIEIESSARLWFYLSQAHGAAIDVEQHDRALAAAQSLDPDEVRRLTERLAGPSPAAAAGMPIPQVAIRARLLAHAPAPDSLPLRAHLAPGWLGSSLPLAVAAFVAAAALGVLVGSRIAPSTGCLDCGAHLCPRCGNAARGDGRCEACQRRRFEGRGAWETRSARSIAERLARAARFGLPGLVDGGSPGFGLAVAIAASAALLFAFRHAALLPDPGSIGGAGSIAFLGAAALCVGVHVCLALAARRSGRRVRA